MYGGCDVVVIALPLDATIEEVRSLREREFQDGQVVIDVASVKGPVEEAGRAIAAFVPTHPMAGSEQRGPAGARADLFEGRSWCYVPTEDQERTHMARAFIDRTGAHSYPVDAREHDRIVALTSHLPQAIAYAFKACIEGGAVDSRTIDALCGPVAQELLRIGSSSHAMWDPVFEANAAAIGEALDRLESELRRTLEKDIGI